MPPRPVRFPRRFQACLLLLVATLAAPPAALAQEPAALAQEPVVPAQAPGASTAPADTLLAVRLRDGTTVVGRSADASADPLVLVTAHGTLRIPRADIAEVTSLDASSMKSGQYWPPSPNETRLLFAPTGRMLRRGEKYFSNTYLFFQHFAGGLSNSVTMGAGMSLFPTDDPMNNVFYLTPKVGIYSSPGVNVAVGMLAGYVPGFEDGDLGDSFGILYGVSTFGSRDSHLTTGLGLGYANGDLAQDPVLMIGGEQRISRRVSLVTENYVFPGAEDGFDNLVSYGVRIFGERLSVDLALLNRLGAETAVFPGIPYVAFAVKF